MAKIQLSFTTSTRMKITRFIIYTLVLGMNFLSLELEIYLSLELLVENK